MERKRIAGRGCRPGAAWRKRGAIIARPAAVDHEEIAADRMEELERRLAILISLPQARRRAYVLGEGRR